MSEVRNVCKCGCKILQYVRAALREKDNSRAAKGSPDSGSFKTNTGTLADERTESKINPPEFWMYVLAAFFPVLQWMWMGAYISKNQFDDAKAIFAKPLIAQIFCQLLWLILFMLIFINAQELY